jgi:hypothetical protein
VKKVDDGKTTLTNARSNGAYSFDLLNRALREDSFDAQGLFLGTETARHDGQGARVEDGTLKLELDGLQRLVTVKKKLPTLGFQQVGYYTYDAHGRRVSKTATA